MTPWEFETIRSAGPVLALVAVAALQRAWPHAAQRRARGGNLGLFVLNTVATGVVCGGCAFTVAAWGAQNGTGVFRWLGFPGALNIAATVLMLDLVSYGWHRANHRIALLWRFHQVHHSDATFSVTTALRFHPGELLMSLPLRLTAMALLGADVVAVLVFEVVFSCANLVEHGDFDLPLPFERAAGRLVVTPALHRLHHSRRIPEQDSNFGTILMIWDRLLGTRRENSSDAAVDTGLAGLAESPPLLQALAMPLHSDASRP